MGGGTPRGLLADGLLPGDPLLDRVPGDRCLASVMLALAPAERDIVHVLVHPGITTWPKPPN
ncbi:hypothetical protein [Kitasatospora griseola]|uniref:hypothetical protein n=1 Tax=Kitasatospora griseola TaxID=2064 RepID=UPI0034389799